MPAPFVKPFRSQTKTATLVIGASGGVGAGIVGALLATGRGVVAIARDGGGLARLHEDFSRDPRLTLLPGSVASEAEATQLVRALRTLRVRPEAAVIAVGAPKVGGALLDRDGVFLADQFATQVLPHFHAAKALIPLLAEAAPDRLLLSIGSAAAQFPWAGYGHVSVCAAAQRMLIEALADECAHLPVRVQMLMLWSLVRTPKNTSHACPDWMLPEDVGRAVIDLIDNPASRTPIVHLRGPRAGGCGKTLQEHPNTENNQEKPA